MTYDFKFNLIGIAIILLLLIGTSVYIKFPSRNKQHFFLFSITAVIYLALEVAVVFCLMHLTNTTTATLLTVLFEIAKNAMPVIYYGCVLSMLYEPSEIPVYKKLLIIIPGVYELLAIVSSPFTHFVMYIDETLRYTQGLGSTINSMILVLYLILGLFELVLHFQKISGRHVVFIVAYTLSTAVASVMMFINPYVLISGLSSAISIIFFYFVILNPVEFIDTTTGSYNKVAFSEYLAAKRVLRKKKTAPSLAIIHITNTETAKNQFGIDSSNLILKQYINQISTLSKEKKFFYLFDDTFVFFCKNPDTAMSKLYQLFSYQALPLYLSNGRKQITYPVRSQLFLIKDLCSIQNINNAKKGISFADKLVDLLQFTVSVVDKSITSIQVIDSNLTDSYNEKVQIQKYVNESIEKEGFEVFLQPIYDIKTGKFTAAESLIRLQSPDGRYISPGFFIPEAERNGNILALGDISIKKTCEFITKSKLQNLGVSKVSINLSAVQCMQDGIASHILSIIDSYRIPKNLIRFEITESLIETDLAHLEKLMLTLSEHGIEFALDDFGTGYTNISKLLHLPFNQIKFDKSFIMAIAKNKKEQIPLKHLMGMFREYSKQVLVTGVESKEMSDLVKIYGGDYIQGFYYAKPMPIDQYTSFITGNNK